MSLRMGAGSLVTLILVGCGDANITDPSKIVFPLNDVSYTQHVRPFLSLSCAFSGCHNDASAAGGIRFTSYNSLIIDRPNLVVPSKPDESLLIQVVDQLIPHRFDALRNMTAAQRQGLRTWVQEGALNN